MITLAITCCALTALCMWLITQNRALRIIQRDNEMALRHYERIIYNGEDEQ